MGLRPVLIAGILAAAAGGCGASGDHAYLDQKFRDSPKAYTNVFELLKTYSKQDEAPGQMGEVRVIKYYEANQRLAGFTNKAEGWFVTITEDEVRSRLVRLIEKRAPSFGPGVGEINGPVRVNGGFGFYAHNGVCYYITVFKRVGPTTIYDNDYGEPDFSGTFDICNGLNVSPEQFIAKIGLADEAAEARYRSLVSGK